MVRFAPHGQAQAEISEWIRNLPKSQRLPRCSRVTNLPLRMIQEGCGVGKLPGKIADESVIARRAGMIALHLAASPTLVSQLAQAVVLPSISQAKLATTPVSITLVPLLSFPIARDPLVSRNQPFVTTSALLVPLVSAVRLKKLASLPTVEGKIEYAPCLPVFSVPISTRRLTAH
jgi:hypothetical protein